MNNVFVVSHNSKTIGVYTSHMKAIQAIIMETLMYGYQMNDYTYDMGIEFYTFIRDNSETVYELQEIALDDRA